MKSSDDDAHSCLSDTAPKDSTDHNNSGEATLSLYQVILADQRQELQKLLNDWSRCQDQIFDRMLAAHVSLAHGVPNTPREQSPQRSKELENGSDSVLNSEVAPETPRIPGQSSESLLSLRAGGKSMRYSSSVNSFTKDVESSTDSHDRLQGKKGLARSMLYLMHWSEGKYRQGEICIRETHNGNVMTRIVLSNAFQNASGAVILANSIFLGFASDYAAHNLEDPSTPLMNTIEAVFTVFYAIELVMRMIAFGWFYIFSPDWTWNLFDLFLVLSSAWGFVQEHLVGGASGSNSSVLRTARIPKMIRLLRAFRIFKAFRELRLLLNLIAGSMKSMLWASMLMCIVSYVTGNIFLQAATAGLQDGQEDHVADHIRKYWSSLADSMLNLYSAVCGGVDWKDMALSMLRLGTFYCILFLLYIAFFVFVILNTLTSLFMCAALKNSDSDQQSMIYNELRKKQEHIRKIRAVFRSITKRGDNELISRDDMDKVLQDPKMMAFMSSVEIDSADVEEFFNVLSNDGKHAVDIESFVVGCMKMRGAARSMDLLGLIHRHNSDILHFKEIQKRLMLLQQSISAMSQQSMTTLCQQSSSRLSEHKDRDPFDALCRSTLAV